MAEVGRIYPKKRPDAIRPVEPVVPGQRPDNNLRGRKPHENIKPLTAEEPGDSDPNRGERVNLTSDPNEPTQPETGNTVDEKA